MWLAIIIVVLIIIFLFTPDSGDTSFHDDDFHGQNHSNNHSETHAEWVERDKEKHRHISEQYDWEWAEEYMDENDV